MSIDQDKKEWQGLLDKYCCNDFLGFLKGKEKEVKKLRVLEIYRYLHRISMEKVKLFADSPVNMLLLLYYMKETKLRRFHIRATMNKNIEAYYRGVENLINNSRFKKLLLQNEGQNFLTNIVPP